MSTLLSGIRAEGAVLTNAVLEAPWSIRFADRAPLTMITVLRGGGTLLLPGGIERRIVAGDTAIVKGWIDRVWNYGFAYGRSKPRLAGKRMLWLALAGAADDDAIVELMQQALSTQLDDGIAYYCGFTQSSVGLLPGAEEKRQRLDDAGNLLLDEALTGAVRDAHYAELENRALGFVEDFLAADRVPA